MPVGGPSFGTVRKARELMKERAEEFIRLYLQTWKEALAAGDYETAQKCASDIMKHIPKDEDGNTVFDPDIDRKPELKEGKTGPTIQMGIVIGGITKALPETSVEVIEIKKDDSTE